VPLWPDVLTTGPLPQSDIPFIPSPDQGLSIYLGQPSVTAVSAVITAAGTLLRALSIPPLGSG